MREQDRKVKNSSQCTLLSDTFSARRKLVAITTYLLGRTDMKIFIRYKKNVSDNIVTELTY